MLNTTTILLLSTIVCCVPSNPLWPFFPTRVCAFFCFGTLAAFFEPLFNPSSESSDEDDDKAHAEGGTELGLSKGGSPRLSLILAASARSCSLILDILPPRPPHLQQEEVFRGGLQAFSIGRIHIQSAGLDRAQMHLSTPCFNPL